MTCHARQACRAGHQGTELGWFEHGSTILVFAPAGFALCAGIEPGHRIRMGDKLMTLPLN
jgi:phosphatidylserine decarboxylase